MENPLCAAGQFVLLQTGCYFSPCPLIACHLKRQTSSLLTRLGVHSVFTLRMCACFHQGSVLVPISLNVYRSTTLTTLSLANTSTTDNLSKSKRGPKGLMYRWFKRGYGQNKGHCWRQTCYTVVHSLCLMIWTLHFILTILFSFLALPLFSSQGFLVCPKQLTVIPLQNVHSNEDLLFQILMLCYILYSQHPITHFFPVLPLFPLLSLTLVRLLCLSSSLPLL